MLQGISVYCEKYNLVGKIDVFDEKTGILTECKKKIKTVYDGYIYQIYAQYSLHLGLIIPNNFYCCRSAAILTSKTRLIIPNNFYCCRSTKLQKLHKKINNP